MPENGDPCDRGTTDRRISSPWRELGLQYGQAGDVSPGLARLATWPVPTGSHGHEDDGDRRCRRPSRPPVKREPRVTIRSICAEPGPRQFWDREELPSASRTSIRMFSPSISRAPADPARALATDDFPPGPRPCSSRHRCGTPPRLLRLGRERVARRLPVSVQTNVRRSNTTSRCPLILAAGRPYTRGRARGLGSFAGSGASRPHVLRLHSTP